MATLIFSTIHGSHLYGMDHEGSDMDIFEVTTSTRYRARHSYNAETRIDTCRMGLSTFRQRFTEGSHQSVEALFSPFKVWHDEELRQQWEPYLNAQRIQGQHVFAKYERTIKSFCFGDFKMRRHAVRLRNNLMDLRTHGRFNPVMSEADKIGARMWAERYEGEALWFILRA